MGLFYFEGTARQRGALGITHPFNAEVRAENEESAKRALYDNWEHITLTHCNKWLMCPVCHTATRSLYAEQAGSVPENYACVKCAPAMWKAADNANSQTGERV